MSTKGHLTLAERKEIDFFLNERAYSMRMIAKLMNRNVSTISREIKRNKQKKKDIYIAPNAHHQAYTNRKYSKYQAMKVRKHKFIETYVSMKMKEHWSPEKIALRWNKVDKGESDPTLSHKAIYKYLYSSFWADLTRCLYTKRDRRVKRKQKKEKRETIKFRIPIEQRRKIINERKEVWHYEADLIVSKRGDKSCILKLIDRKTRILRARKLPNKQAEGVHKVLSHFVNELKVKSITFDNGTEFAHHHQLRKLWIETYHCNPYSSWEKGSIERANRDIRMFIPKKSCIKNYSQTYIENIVQQLNDIPKICLWGRTPNEVHYWWFD